MCVLYSCACPNLRSSLNLSVPHIGVLLKGALDKPPTPLSLKIHQTLGPLYVQNFQTGPEAVFSRPDWLTLYRREDLWVRVIYDGKNRVVLR